MIRSFSFSEDHPRPPAGDDGTFSPICTRHLKENSGVAWDNATRFPETDERVRRNGQETPEREASIVRDGGPGGSLCRSAGDSPVWTRRSSKMPGMEDLDKYWLMRQRRRMSTWWLLCALSVASLVNGSEEFLWEVSPP